MGRDIWPVLSDDAKTPHEAFFYHKGNQLAAVRSGDWKLHVDQKGKPSELFNLMNDIGEKTNVLKANPEVVKRLRGHLTAFAKDISTRPQIIAHNE